ncbi:hypothetical protein BC749_11114 [Flavobacterium araucananum]|uniref:Uncharacterized protein n=1 Tax=Flavobacterium araucananum TaxID=946678 RepID=A0A227P284_9FLAO|nr:hypothetical protein B0A64_16835 [Flavobacterium araucananum]PWJ96025.1 hypothetical protein BC749_11114 [Flavobacterium araucananum]
MYSSSKCPHCQKTGFEVATEAPKDSNFKLMFVRCQWCKTVVGVLDYYNIGTLVHKLAKKLNVNLDS